MTQGSSRGRLLVLMRHGSAESFAAADHERALTGRGRRDAAEAGAWLAAEGIGPDHALVSPAVRTLGTWEEVAKLLHTAAEVDVADALYAASPETTLDFIRAVPSDAGTVVVVGHNPTTAYLAHSLDDGTGDPDAFRAMSEGYPTAAVTVLEVAPAWPDLAEATCRIVAFHVGRGAPEG